MFTQSIFPVKKESYVNLGDMSSPFPNNIDGPSNQIVHNSQNYPFPYVEGALVSDSFPVTHKNGVSTQQEQKMWWHFPVFQVGSYEQITNNLKYPNNPDVGQCMPTEFCGTLHKEFQPQLNEARVLPPVIPSCNGRRINYYNTTPNMLTYQTENGINILY